LFDDTIQPGATWSHILKRGTVLRITDVEGGGNVGAIFYNADNCTERYNMPDTLKAQHTAHLTEGDVLFSDMGRILCSITADTLGWHDPLSGCSNPALVAAKYGQARYQEHRNDCYKNAYDGFIIELAKHGLTVRDLAAPINFFSRVVVGDDGGMRFVSGHSRPGDYVELRAEMNVLAILNTCQHPLDPNTKYQPKQADLWIRKATMPPANDPCRVLRPENERGFVLTERYFM
jgi:uncharacterized protein